MWNYSLVKGPVGSLLGEPLGYHLPSCTMRGLFISPFLSGILGQLLPPGVFLHFLAGYSQLAACSSGGVLLGEAGQGGQEEEASFGSSDSCRPTSANNDCRQR